MRAALAALAAVGVCLYHGRVGLMPLDQSIVFDGGWRVLSGQVPLRDFSLPGGLVPVAIQALFFRALGVTWFAYCLHAALFNGLFAVIVYVWLRRCTLRASPAFACALGSGVVFYPPFGVPFMDQHAFFFGLLAVVLASEAHTAHNPRARLLAQAALPWIAALAFLSKPVPTVFLLPALAVVFAVPRRGRAALVLAASSMALVAAAAAMLAAAGIEWGAAAEALLRAPSAAGAVRLRSLSAPTGFAGALIDAHRAWALLCVACVHLAALAALAGLLMGRVSPGAAWRALLAEWLLLACALTAAVTKNEPENDIAYAFVALGLVLSSLQRLAPSRADVLGLAAVAVVAVDAARFEWRVNLPRLVHGFSDRIEAPQSLPPGLSFLVWRLPGFYDYTAADLSRLLAFLGANPGNVFVLGDTSILYGLSGRPSVNPALWFHPRLTVPGRATRGFAAYQARLVERLAGERVRFVIVETTGTFMGVRLAHLPLVREWIRAREVGRRGFGGFELIELAP